MNLSAAAVSRSRRLVFALAVAVLSDVSGLEAQSATGAVEVAFNAADRVPTLRLTGYLYRPGGHGSFPGVVLLHDCTGITPVLHRWGTTLRRWGYAALLVDSFGPRNETSEVCSTSSSASVSPQYDRMPDAYAGMRYPARQSFVDPQRIGLMGWGHGGWTLLLALDEIYLTEIASPPFRAAIALYPWCGFTRVHKLNSPLLILSGAADDWTPASLCIELLARSNLRESSIPHGAALKIYPRAHHRFDDFDPPAPYLSYTVGRNPEAAAQAEADVKHFFAAHLSSDTQTPSPADSRGRR